MATNRHNISPNSTGKTTVAGLKQLKNHEQKQLECLLSYVEPRKHEFVEPSSLTWQLLNENLLTKDNHLADLGTTTIQVWNIRLTTKGQEWIAEHTKPTIWKRISKLVGDFLWQIVVALLALIGGIVLWMITK